MTKVHQLGASTDLQRSAAELEIEAQQHALADWVHHLTDDAYQLTTGQMRTLENAHRP